MSSPKPQTYFVVVVIAVTLMLPRRHRLNRLSVVVVVVVVVVNATTSSSSQSSFRCRRRHRRHHRHHRHTNNIIITISPTRRRSKKTILSTMTAYQFVLDVPFKEKEVAKENHVAKRLHTLFALASFFSLKGTSNTNWYAVIVLKHARDGIAFYTNIYTNKHDT
jgi:hypothetical protein